MMLLYKKLDTLVVRSQYVLEPVERFEKRHLAYAAGQIIRIGDYLLFSRQRQIIFLRQSQLHCFSGRNTGADVSFNDTHELL